MTKEDIKKAWEIILEAQDPWEILEYLSDIGCLNFRGEELMRKIWKAYIKEPKT